MLRKIRRVTGVPLANHKSAIKRIRINERRRVRNRIVVSHVRTEVREAREKLAGTEFEAARKATLEAIRVLDKAASKGILHKNNAARRKGRLMKRLAALQASTKK